MTWSIKNPEMWILLTEAVENTGSLENTAKLLESLENAGLYDMAYLVAKQLNHTRIGGQVQQKVMTDVFQEIWGDDMTKEFVTRYIKDLKKMIKKDKADKE